MPLYAAALTALACVSPGRAHHSSSMFDTQALWIKGIFVRFERINPHSIIIFDETTEDGQVRRWSVEGRIPRQLEERGIGQDFLEAGNVIELCVFPLKEEHRSRYASARTTPFVHGHVLVMPDGQKKSWGSYGKLQSCVRPDDDLESWLDLLNTDAFARGSWCNKSAVPIAINAASRDLFEEIDKLMARPCG